MNVKILAASGAILLMALGGGVAEARNLGGGGGGGGGGPHFSGGGGGGGPRFSGGSGRIYGGNVGRSYRSGPSFRGNNFARGRYRRGPVVGWKGGGRNYWRHHHRRGPRFFVGYPYYYYGDYYDYGYSGGCGWLYDRAVSTGSSYWWRRYEICVGEG